MIDLLIPTRGRPKRVERLLKSIVDTIGNKDNISVYFYCDDDDSIEAKNYIKNSNNIFDLNIKYLIGDRIVLSKCWDELWKISYSSIIMHCADDIIFTSKDWDIKVIDHFKNDFNGDELFLLYGPDGIQNEKLATHSFTSRKASKILGYFVPPYFACDYNDTWLNEIYQAIGRRVYDPSISIEHEHFSKYSNNFDQTYANIRSKFNESTLIWEQKKSERLDASSKLWAEINKVGE